VRFDRVGFHAKARSCEVKTLVYFSLAVLVAAHDLHDDAGDHEGDNEKDGVEGYAHYVHEKVQVALGL
jgi:hypothetical protein